jgi:hypothetical protein
MTSHDKFLDTLYIQCFNQQLRAYVSPVFVEKTLLKKHVEILRNYILEYTAELIVKVNTEKKCAEDSYLTWNPNFYTERAKKREDDIRAFEKKIQNTSPDEFLGEDFTTINEDLELAFPKSLPRSSARANLWKRWQKFKSKQD